MTETKPYGTPLDQWNETREITFQIVNAMPDDIDINWKPHPEMNELGKLLRHSVGAIYFQIKNYLKSYNSLEIKKYLIFSRHYVFAACGTPDVIPSDTPAARKIIRNSRSIFCFCAPL